MSLLQRSVQLVSRAVAATKGNGLYAASAPSRGMAGGSHAHHGNPNDYVTYAGVTLKKPSSIEYLGSKALGATMWFWVFYRLYHDWDHKVRGLAYVFEKEGDDDDEHGHSHGHH